MDGLVPQINAALECAKAAVEADNNADYTLAVKKYREVLEALDRVKDKIVQEAARTALDEKVFVLTPYSSNCSQHYSINAIKSVSSFLNEYAHGVLVIACPLTF
jgi:hypothetical protein